MFFSLKHKNKKRQDDQNLKTDKIATMWSTRFKQAQYNIASFLQAKSEMLSLKAKKFIVIALSIISFSSCIYLVTKSLFRNHHINLSIQALRFPEQVIKSDGMPVSATGLVSKIEFKKIKEFRAYIDSLATSIAGKKVYDSIRMNRPGLIDSLSIVENIYQLQSSKK